jgi:hypothetical protein
MVCILSTPTILFLQSYGVTYGDDWKSNMGLKQVIVVYFIRSLHFLNLSHSGQKYSSKHFIFYRLRFTFFPSKKTPDPKTVQTSLNEKLNAL